VDDVERYYQVLGLKRGASADQVKEAYRDLAKVWHPDRFGTDPRLQHKAQEKLKEINRAYSYLLSFLSGGGERRSAQPSQPSEGSQAARPRPAASSVSNASLEIARTEIGDVPLIITSEKIRFGVQQIRTRSVTAIRYGVMDRSFFSNASYAIWLTDGKSELHIECATPSTLSTMVEQRYKEALDALWKAVQLPLIQTMLNAFIAGRGFEIGGIRFDFEGLHRARDHQSVLATSAADLPIGKALKEGWHFLTSAQARDERKRNYQHLPWSDFGGHITVSGLLVLHRQNQVWADLGLRETWNAVCLGPILSYLKEGGRIRQLIKAQKQGR